MEKNMMIMVVLICDVSVSLVITMIPRVDAAYKRPDMYIVGDYLDGWELQSDHDYNFNDDWASRHQFYTGDWLFFGYDPKLYNVLVVNETDYKKCRSVDPIQNLTGSVAGQVLFNLSSPRTYYFISGGGVYCSSGMKLAVVVIDTVFYRDAPAPSENVRLCSDSGRNVVSTVIGTIVVACTLVWVVWI